MANIPSFRSVSANQRFWLGIAAGALVVAGAAWWAVGSYRRGQARDGLNAFGAFQRPPLELLFPRLVMDTEASRKILEPGVEAGIWTLHQRGGNSRSASHSLEVRLTDQGQRWFSVVGNQVVATFAAGTREVTRVVELNEIFPSRQVRFLYRWRGFHPGSAVLGAELPEVGKQYEGQALFLYETDGWRVMHWTAPEFDHALARFKELEPASN